MLVQWPTGLNGCFQKTVLKQQTNHEIIEKKDSIVNNRGQKLHLRDREGENKCGRIKFVEVNKKKGSKYEYI